MKYDKDQFLLSELPYTSIQGEGRFVGHPMTYVRLQGCPVGCNWCDSKYTWKPYNQENMYPEIKSSDTTTKSFKELEKLLAVEQSHHIWFTGGEPTIQGDAIKNFITYAKKDSHSILPDREYHICTAGQILNKKLFDILDYITIDIKAPTSTAASNLKIVKEVIDRYLLEEKVELKMVVANNTEDMEYAKEIVNMFDTTPITLQPLYVSESEIITFDVSPSTSRWNYADFAAWVNDTFRNYYKVRMGLQLHKVIWPDKTRLI